MKSISSLIAKIRRKIENSFHISESDRVEMLAIALNFPDRKKATRFTPTDLEELETILKKHYRH